MPSRFRVFAFSCLHVFVPSWLIVFVISTSALAQRRAATTGGGVTRIAILEAEDRRAPTASDVALLRAGTRSAEPQIARIAVRALGRLERPSLVPDILPSLKHPMPEVRAEAANALGQALAGSAAVDAPRTPAVRATSARPAPASSPVDVVLSALIARLTVEADATVRGTIAETLGRIPTAADEIARAEETLVATFSRERSVDGRLGIASGFEALARLHGKVKPLGDDAIAALASLAAPAPAGTRPSRDQSRDVRVRRVALEALIAANAVAAATRDRAAADPDPQVRRLAMRAAALDTSGSAGTLTKGLTDAVAMVRYEALRAMPRARGAEVACHAAVIATGDEDPHVVLLALDQLASCGASTDAVAVLQRTVDDLSDAGKPRAWHRGAHAIVALAAVAPARAAAALPQFTGSRIWQLRMYAARAATTLATRAVLEKLAADDNDNVREAAIDGLSNVAGHAADSIYIGELDRAGYQVLRAAARALDGTPNQNAAIPTLQAALQRLVREGRDNSHDARDAIAETLRKVGADPRVGPEGNGRPHGAAPTRSGASDAVDASELRRLASARARITIAGVGSFDLVLFANEAPATVTRFARLAQSGYYNGLTFHRVVPNFVIQGGSPGANEYIGDAMFMRDELGRWPHVRGAVGISTRGRDTGDAQIFIDLVDNPRLNHEYTVFAQVLTGLEVVDRIVEGDVIERVDIVGAR